MARRIKVKGVRKSEIDTEQLALIYPALLTFPWVG